MKTKKFDCIEMKRQGAENVQKKTAGMSMEEELEYWQESYERLKEHQKKLKNKLLNFQPPAV
jgi:hypothetical protein